MPQELLVHALLNLGNGCITVSRQSDPEKRPSASGSIGCYAVRIAATIHGKLVSCQAKKHASDGAKNINGMCELIFDQGTIMLDTSLLKNCHQLVSLGGRSSGPMEVHASARAAKRTQR